MANFLYTIIIYPLYTIIEVIYMFAMKVTDNKGLSVIAVSVGITLLCLPLYAVAEKWQEVERNKQAQMKGYLKRIKETFTGDERYMMTTAYYKENNYSPIMSLRSSFGLLIQIPFFIAAYTFLSHLESLNGVSFLFIRDMGHPDALFSIGSFQINILPIAMTLINMISGAIYTKGHSVREKIQVYGMALIFLVILYNSPAGLVLYWTMNNVFSMIKNIFYKFKKPLKAFWLFCCIVSCLALIYILFIFKTKTAYKGIFTIIVLLIFIAPLLVKAVQKLLDTRFKSLTESKSARHGVFLASILVLFILSGLTIPSSLMASSPTEFAGIGNHPNPIWYIFNTTLQSAGLFLFWFVCIYFLFNNRIQTILAVISSILALSALLNTYIFMPSYGDISYSLAFLNAVNFRTFSSYAILNLLSLLLLTVLVVLFVHLTKGKVFTYTFTILSLALTAISAYNIFSIQKSYIAYKDNSEVNAVSNVSPIYHFSKTGKNVLLIMLDRAQCNYVQEIMKESPDLLSSFSGFTLYPNTVSFNGHTLQAAPAIWGGYEYTPLEMNKRDDVPLKDKNNESLLMMPRLFSEDLDFNVTITDPSWANYSAICDLSFLEPYPKINGYKTIGGYTDYWLKKQNGNEITDYSEDILKRNLFFFSLFREIPVCFREILYYKGKYWSSNDKLQDNKLIMDNYTALAVLQDLTSFDGNANGSYTCIVNELTHENYYFEAPDYIPVKNVINHGTSKYKDFGDYHTQIAAFKMVGKWFDFLKENGIYDNTRIIVVSDHGNYGIEEGFEKDDDLDNKVADTNYSGRGHYHPLLLFKDFNTLNNELLIDDTFMTNADVLSLLLKDLIQKPVNPFTKKEIPINTILQKQNGVIISTSDKHQPAYNGKFKYTIGEDNWWLVKDNIFKSDNWSQVKPDLEE